MASADLMLEVFPRDLDRLSDGAILTAFLHEVVNQGYLVLPEENSYELVKQMDAAQNLKPQIVDQARNALEAYNGGKRDLFDCYLRFTPAPEEDYGLFFRMTVYRGGPLLLGVNDGTFKYNEFGLRNYERFLDFVSLVYQTWPPLYGYMSDGPSWEPEEVRALDAHALYELTLFGPEYVNKIGHNKFNAIHVWRKIRMEDGGYIIAVGLYARYTDPTLEVHPQAVAQALGLDSPDFMD